jgi:hypothetical protein
MSLRSSTYTPSVPNRACYSPRHRAGAWSAGDCRRIVSDLLGERPIRFGSWISEMGTGMHVLLYMLGRYHHGMHGFATAIQVYKLWSPPVLFGQSSFQSQAPGLR